MLRVSVVGASLLILMALSTQAQGPKADRADSRKMTLPEAIEFIRPSVVQISLRVDPPPDTAGLFQHPTRSVFVTLGSGFLVSADGYAVTARHVVHPAIQIEGRRTLVVGLALPNLENYNSGGATLSIRGSFRFIECEIVDEDVRHDLALLKLARNPFADNTNFITGPKETVGYPRRVATLSRSARPRDGDSIAVSGYPLNQTVMITTSGNLASSWAYDSVAEQIPGARAGFLSHDIADSYIGDMHVNPGNSGGPVFSVEQGEVIGVCVAYDMAPVVYGDGNHEPASAGNRPLFSNSGLSVIIPVRYVIELLKKHSLG
jgi:S1-C subfamily serine protease